MSKAAIAEAPKKRLSHDERRKIVLEAARQVFMEQGYGGASMRPIAARAGITEAMLYRICPSKQELFEDAVAAPVEEAVNRTAELAADFVDASDLADIKERSRKFAIGLIDAMKEVAPLMMAMMLTDKKTGEHFYRTRFAPALEQTTQVIEGEAAFWEHRTLNPTLIVKSVFGMCWFLALDGRFGSGRAASSEELADHVMELVFEGLSAGLPD